MSRRFLMALLGAVLLVAACGGESEGSDTTTSDTTDDGGVTTTTEAPAEDPDDDGGTVGLGDIPQECIDAFVAYLQAIESVVEDVDWSNATMTDLEELGTALEPATEEFEETTADSQCDDIDVDATDEESFDYMIDLAREEAPGTVPYLEMIRDFAGDLGEDFGESTIDVSGDCETDIAALQAIIDEGGTMQELTVADITSVGSLATSITANCPPARSAEFFSQEDVTNFMGG